MTAPSQHPFSTTYPQMGPIVGNNMEVWAKFMHMFGWAVGRIDPNNPDALHDRFFGRQGLSHQALMANISHAHNNGFSVAQVPQVGVPFKDCLAIIQAALKWASSNRNLCRIIVPNDLVDLPAPPVFFNYLHLQMSFNILTFEEGYLPVVEAYGLTSFVHTWDSRDGNSSLARVFQLLDGFLGGSSHAHMAVANVLGSSGIPYSLLAYPEHAAQELSRGV